MIMKKLLFVLILFFNFSLFAQQTVKITTKKCIPKKGFYLKLKKVVSDSRCPEDVNCIWAGEVSVIIQVFNNKEFVEEKTISFNTNNNNYLENTAWFSKYYTNKIKTIAVLPYPKSGVIVKSGKHYILIGFQE